MKGIATPGFNKLSSGEPPLLIDHHVAGGLGYRAENGLADVTTIVP